MSRINNRKYNYLANELTSMLTTIDDKVGPTWFAKNYSDAIRLVANAHNSVQSRKVREMAKFLEDMPLKERFNKCQYFESPSYYGYGSGDSDSIRGHDLESAYKLMSNLEGINEVYWSDLDGYSFWDQADQERFLELVAQDPESFGVTLLCLVKEVPYTDRWGKERVERVLDVDQPVFGDERILSEEDWDKIIEGHEHYGTDLVWHEVGGFDIKTLINIVEAIDEDHDRWNGNEEADDDCILARLQALHEEQPLVAMMVAEKIEQIIANTKNTWGRRYKLCENLLKKAEYDIED